MSARRRVRKVWAVAGLIILVLFAGLQLFQPPAPTAALAGEEPISAHIPVPDHVGRLLRESCYDCHSDETRWPWYARISPVSWLIANDVRHGRGDLDFTRWSTHPTIEPTPVQRLTWICRDVREGIMPPRLYEILHPEARLSDAEKAEICAWTAEALKRVTR